MNGLKDILERLKIEQLNPMQEASVEAFDKGGEDLILLSPTGSGKTLAFLECRPWCWCHHVSWHCR